MKIHNPFMLTIAVMQLIGAAYYWIKLKSPILSLIQISYALSNILYAFMKGM